MPVAESGEETYGAENQDVKSDPVSLYQCPLFSVIFLIVLGISVGGKRSIFIKTYLKLLVFYEKKNQNSSRSSLLVFFQLCCCQQREEHKFLSLHLEPKHHLPTSPPLLLAKQSDGKSALKKKLFLYIYLASFVAQLVKNLPAMQETWVRSLGWEETLGERKGYPFQYSGLENSMDCTVHGVIKSWT